MAKSGCFQEADQRVEGPRTYVIVKSLWALFVFLYYAYFPLGEKKANFMQSARLSEVKKKVVAFYQEISKIKVKEYTSRRGCGETPVLAHCWPAGPAAVGPLVTTRAPPATAAAGASPGSLPPFCSFLCFGQFNVTISQKPGRTALLLTSPSNFCTQLKQLGLGVRPPLLQRDCLPQSVSLIKNPPTPHATPATCVKLV